MMLWLTDTVEHKDDTTTTADKNDIQSLPKIVIESSGLTYFFWKYSMLFTFDILLIF